MSCLPNFSVLQQQGSVSWWLQRATPGEAIQENGETLHLFTLAPPGPLDGARHMPEAVPGRRLSALNLSTVASPRSSGWFLFPIITRVTSPKCRTEERQIQKNNYPLIGQFKRELDDKLSTAPYQRWLAAWPDAPLIRVLNLDNVEALLINTPETHKEAL